MTLRAMLVINFSQYVVLSLFINFPLYVVTRPELVSTLAGAAPISRELCKVKSYPEQQTLYTRHSQLAAKLQVTKLWRVAAGPFSGGAEPYHYLHHVTFTQNHDCPTPYLLCYVTFQLDDLVSNFAHINVPVLVSSEVIVGELVYQLRFVIGLVVVRLNGLSWSTQLLPKR